MDNLIEFKKLPKFTTFPSYEVTIELKRFKNNLDYYINELNLQIEPDFQRGHIWTELQQIRFIEFWIKGGAVLPLMANHTRWKGDMFSGEFVLVDGLQRYNAITKFINNEFKIFEEYFFKNIIGYRRVTINFMINQLKTRKEVLKWYIELNDGGTPHTQEEIEKVKKLLIKESEQL